MLRSTDEEEKTELGRGKNGGGQKESSEVKKNPDGIMEKLYSHHHDL